MQQHIFRIKANALVEFCYTQPTSLLISGDPLDMKQRTFLGTIDFQVLLICKMKFELLFSRSRNLEQNESQRSWAWKIYLVKS